MRPIHSFSMRLMHSFSMRSMLSFSMRLMHPFLMRPMHSVSMRASKLFTLELTYGSSVSMKHVFVLKRSHIECQLKFRDPHIFSFFLFFFSRGSFILFSLINETTCFIFVLTSKYTNTYKYKITKLKSKTQKFECT